jgi:hypothetical protein
MIPDMKDKNHTNARIPAPMRNGVEDLWLESMLVFQAIKLNSVVVMKKINIGM